MIAESKVTQLINEALSKFSTGEERAAISRVFEKLTPHITNILERRSPSEGNCAEEILALKEIYQTNLQSERKYLIPIHLFALTVFGLLEKEAGENQDCK